MLLEFLKILLINRPIKMILQKKLILSVVLSSSLFSQFVAAQEDTIVEQKTEQIGISEDIEPEGQEANLDKENIETEATEPATEQKTVSSYYIRSIYCIPSIIISALSLVRLTLNFGSDRKEAEEPADDFVVSFDADKKSILIKEGSLAGNPSRTAGILNGYIGSDLKEIKIIDCNISNPVFFQAIIPLITGSPNLEKLVITRTVIDPGKKLDFIGDGFYSPISAKNFFKNALQNHTKLIELDLSGYSIDGLSCDSGHLISLSTKNKNLKTTFMLNQDYSGYLNSVFLFKGVDESVYQIEEMKGFYRITLQTPSGPVPQIKQWFANLTSMFN